MVKDVGFADVGMHRDGTHRYRTVAMQGEQCLSGGKDAPSTAGIDIFGTNPDSLHGRTRMSGTEESLPLTDRLVNLRIAWQSGP